MFCQLPATGACRDNIIVRQNLTLLPRQTAITPAAAKAAPVIAIDIALKTFQNIKRQLPTCGGGAFGGGSNASELADVRTKTKPAIGLCRQRCSDAKKCGAGMAIVARLAHSTRTFWHRCNKSDKQSPAFLCRSGVRSHYAAAAAAAAGWQLAFNILEGFEGDINSDNRRGFRSGWRYRGLPWEQS